MKFRHLAVAVAVATGAVAAVAARDAAPSPAHARSYLVNHMQARADAGGRLTWYESFSDTLPNVTYTGAGLGVATIGQLAVVGRVVDVSPGAAFAPRGTDDGVRVAWDASDALWRTVHATVEVERVLGAGSAPATITVGVATNANADYAHVAAGLESLGRSVFVLTRSPVFSYDASVWSIVEDGALLATVAGDGSLALPFLEEARAGSMLAATPTLTALDALASGSRVVTIARVGGVIQRV